MSSEEPSDSRAPEQLFRSRRHPGDASLSVIFGTALVQPLGACMIPVMLGALTYMLTGRGPLAFLYVGFPLALALASLWTILQLRRRSVEVHIRAEAVQIHSAWDVATGVVAPWASVLDVSEDDGVATVALGHDTRRLVLAEWGSAGRVLSALRQAGGLFAGRVQSHLDP